MATSLCPCPEGRLQNNSPTLGASLCWVTLNTGEATVDPAVPSTVPAQNLIGYLFLSFGAYRGLHLIASNFHIARDTSEKRPWILRLPLQFDSTTSPNTSLLLGEHQHLSIQHLRQVVRSLVH